MDNTLTKCDTVQRAISSSRFAVKCCIDNGHCEQGIYKNIAEAIWANLLAVPMNELKFGLSMHNGKEIIMAKCLPARTRAVACNKQLDVILCRKESKR